MERVKTSLETEQEKLATLVKNLSADPSKEGVGEQKNEEPISEEWLQSLKERRKVSSGSMTSLKVYDSGTVHVHKTYSVSFIRVHLHV